MKSIYLSIQHWGFNYVNLMQEGMNQYNCCCSQKTLKPAYKQCLLWFSSVVSMGMKFLMGSNQAQTMHLLFSFLSCAFPTYDSKKFTCGMLSKMFSKNECKSTCNCVNNYQKNLNFVSCNTFLNFYMRLYQVSWSNYYRTLTSQVRKRTQRQKHFKKLSVGYLEAQI